MDGLCSYCSWGARRTPKPPPQRLNVLPPTDIRIRHPNAAVSGLLLAREVFFGNVWEHINQVLGLCHRSNLSPVKASGINHNGLVTVPSVTEK